MVEYLAKDKDLNPYQKDYYIRQFNDAFYNGGTKYTSNDNFAYVRCTEKDNRTSAILENLLYFLNRYPEFTARTGVGLLDLLDMDPSTTDLLRNIWAELMKPEEKRQAEMSNLQKQISDLNKQLKGG